MNSIEELKLKIKGYNQEIEEIKERMCSLKDELSNVNYKKDMTKGEIKRLLEEQKKKDDKEKRIKSFALSGDNYIDSLRKASLFCDLERTELSSIKAYKNLLASTNGYIGIIIEVPIPKEDWNKNISWDLEKRSILTGDILELLEKVYNTGQLSIRERRFLKKKDIISTLKPEKRKIENGDTVYIFSYDDMQVAIDIEHFNNVLAIFEDDDEVLIKFPSNRIGAVFIEDVNIKAIVMPIKLSESY